jgi:predicted AlkP superfamily pyrophosphatase or phosphodiesterase
MRSIRISAVLALLATLAPVAGRAARSEALAPPPSHYVVFIVIDGGRPSYLKLGHLPHIAALMQRGVVYDRAWVGQLESSTPGVHITFGTGTLPKVNGVLGFQYIDPRTRAKIDIRNLVTNQALESALRRLPVPGVAARLHRCMPKAISIAASSSKGYAVVAMSAGAATYGIFGKYIHRLFVPSFLHTPPPLTVQERKALTVRAPISSEEKDSWAFQYVLSVVRKVTPRLVMMNLPEFDIEGHWNGVHDTGTDTKLIENIDSWIGRLEDAYRARGILDQTDFIITADHGFTQSRPAPTTPTIEAASQRAHARIALISTAGGAISLVNPAQAPALARRLVAMKPSHVAAIFYRSQNRAHDHFVLASPKSWLLNAHVATALQHLVNTTAGPAGPDVWMLLREHYTSHAQNVAGTWKGTHGGATWQVQHVPLIISGPGIESGKVSRFPARAIDMVPTLERLLGLPSLPRTGVVLADALTNPSDSETQAQNALTDQLTSDVNALQAQSAADE